MNDKLKTAIIAASTALVVVLVVVPFLRGAPGVNTIEKIVRETVGAFPGSEISFPVRFSDRFIRGRGFLSTTTPIALTSHTLTASDFNQPEKLRIVTVGGAVDTDYTFTLPASSTVGRSLVPDVGDREELCFYVAASSSKHVLRIIPGTGWDWTIATSTLAAATSSQSAAIIEQNQIGCLDVIREPGVGLNQIGNLNAQMIMRRNANNTTND